MIAITDIIQLVPNFGNAVVNVQRALTGVAFVVCFAGLLMCAINSLRERHLADVIPAMLKIFLISLLLTNLGPIGNWLGDLVTDVEQVAGINGNPMTAFVSAIKAKFGVDISAIIGPISPGGTAGIGQPSAGTLLTHYAYPGDSTPDPDSAHGRGAFGFSSADGSLVPLQSAALTDSAAAQYQVSPGQSFTATASNGQTYSLVYADRAPESDNRVDIYDPTNALGGGNDFSSQITSITNVGQTQTDNGNPVGNFFGMLLHPIESAQIAGLGMACLVLSYIACFIQWLVALAQTVIFYCEIALAPLFVPFLMIRGLESIAKGFLLSFVAVSLWRLAFLATGLISQLLIGLGANSGNNPVAGAMNVAGVSYLWTGCIALFVIAGSLVGPWWISKRFVQGASGITDLLFGVGSAGIRAAQMGGGAIVSSVGAATAPVSAASAAAMNSASPRFSRNLNSSFARRPKE